MDSPFSSGVDVEEEDVPSIIEELIQIKDWAVKNLTEEKGIKCLKE